MASIDLNLVRTFAAVYETGSFSAAGQRLGVPRSTVSRAIAALEEALGSVLFQRTTRKVASTQDGVRLFDRMSPSLAGLEAALADLPDRAEGPSGTLRVTTTVDLGTAVVAPVVSRFIDRYPGASVEMLLGNTLLDLVRDGVDVALRVAGGPMRDSSLIARKVGTVVFKLYASPTYLARRGTPRTPEELRDHEWVTFRGAPMQLTATESKASFSARTRVTCDDMFFAREMLRQGVGIGALPTFVADGEVTQGALVSVLPRWVSAFGGAVYLVHPSRKHVPTRVTAFRDLLLEMLRQRPLS